VGTIATTGINTSSFISAEIGGLVIRLVLKS